MHLFNSYLLDYIDFSNEDLVIDCGTKCWRTLDLALNKKINIKYVKT